MLSVALNSSYYNVPMHSMLDCKHQANITFKMPTSYKLAWTHHCGTLWHWFLVVISTDCKQVKFIKSKPGPRWINQCLVFVIMIVSELTAAINANSLYACIFTWHCCMKCRQCKFEKDAYIKRACARAQPSIPYRACAIALCMYLALVLALQYMLHLMFLLFVYSYW